MAPYGNTKGGHHSGPSIALVGLLAPSAPNHGPMAIDLFSGFLRLWLATSLNHSSTMMMACPVRCRWTAEPETGLQTESSIEYVQSVTVAPRKHAASWAQKWVQTKWKFSPRQWPDPSHPFAHLLRLLHVRMPPIGIDIRWTEQFWTGIRRKRGCGR